MTCSGSNTKKIGNEPTEWWHLERQSLSLHASFNPPSFLTPATNTTQITIVSERLSLICMFLYLKRERRTSIRSVLFMKPRGNPQNVIPTVFLMSSRNLNNSTMTYQTDIYGLLQNHQNNQAWNANIFALKILWPLCLRQFCVAQLTSEALIQD